MAVVRSLNSQTYRAHCSNTFIRDCHNLVASFWNVSFCCARRSCNKVAHEVAKGASRVWIDGGPGSVLPLVLVDRECNSNIASHFNQSVLRSYKSDDGKMLAFLTLNMMNTEERRRWSCVKNYMSKQRGRVKL